VSRLVLDDVQQTDVRSTTLPVRAYRSPVQVTLPPPQGVEKMDDFYRWLMVDSGVLHTLYRTSTLDLQWFFLKMPL
jgi:hypothetical protein